MAASVPSLAHLRREAPRIKEDLFRRTEVTEQLPNGQFVRASLDELLQRAPIQSFAEELWMRFSETLSTAVEFTRGLTPPPDVIDIILTGGGSELPMVRELIRRAEREQQYPVMRMDAAPQWARAASWKTAFPQLAVAVGGAMPVMPEQR
jgi:molecular chaperone DnaK (HSP70)